MGEATRDESTAIAQRLAAWRSCMCAGLVTWPINQERRERTELIAEERQCQAWLAANLRTTTLLMRRIPWRQPGSPRRHIAAVLLVLFAVRPDEGRLFVPVNE